MFLAYYAHLYSESCFGNNPVITVFSIPIYHLVITLSVVLRKWSELIEFKGLVINVIHDVSTDLWISNSDS